MFFGRVSKNKTINPPKNNNVFEFTHDIMYIYYILFYILYILYFIIFYFILFYFIIFISYSYNTTYRNYASYYTNN